MIILKIKSDVATTFTVKPIYSNGLDDWLSRDIPADNAWHIYSYELTESNYSGGFVDKVYLYLDGGSTELKSGMVLFDDFQIAGSSIAVTNLEATLVDSSKIKLQWLSSDPDLSDFYNIYRSTEPGFPLSPDTRIGESSESLYQDSGLTNNTTYYYQVSATDLEGREHPPAGVSMRTSSPGSIPIPEVVSENANPVGKYEKYELLISISNAAFENPYDPDQIDLHAWFWSPEGDSVKMNGFYDNYLGRDQWKIRFAANREGTWSYQVFARDVDGTGSSARGSFQVTASDQKGWIHISPDNPSYLMHDDSSSFYGIAVYYPWSVTESGLDKFEAVNGNFFGYWDCTFDGSGNGGGRYLLESMESGIGKYDQRKAARIDEVLGWAEDRDMKMMFAMWAHPYLRLEGVPWDGGRWFSHNPYSEVVDVDDFYTDSLSRSYQEKHYRYMIARWAYSQSLGIWELINEMHGTTGWVRNESSAKKWVEWVNAYFQENDPFQRPTTASFGGSQGASHFTETDKLGDMPNVHFYEQHGWPNRHPDNIVRSGLANMVSEARKLKSKGARPAFLGEAGYTTMLAEVETQEYTWEMHNTFWAGLANGLASTPFWWELNTEEVITVERLQMYTPFSKFVSGIDFAHQDYTPAKVLAENCDGYFMGAPGTGFAWMKRYDGYSVDALPIYISDASLNNGSYHLEWFNTWTGESAGEDLAICVAGVSWGEVPKGVDAEDVAFKTDRIEDGSTATELNLYLVKMDTLVAGLQPWLPKVDSTIYKIVCYVTDDDGLLDVAYMGPAQISYEGEDQPDPHQAILTEGGVLIDYQRHGSAGVTVTATIEGLGSASLYIEGITGMEEMHSPAASKGFSMKDNYPNPFHQSTTIGYVLAKNTPVKLAVYNSRGQMVTSLVDEEQAAGSHRVNWDASDLPSGSYYFRIVSRYFTETKHCILLK